MTPSPARVALDARPEAILERLPAMGRVMLVGRNDGVTHERIGPVGDVMARGGYARISGDCHDGALISLRVDKVVLDVSSTMKDKVFPRIDFMTKDGIAAASVVGMEGLEPFEAALADVARGAAEDAPPREAPGERQELADDDPARAPFEAAVASGAAVRIEFRGPSFTQRWQGRIEATRPAMGFLNVMTPDFHLHLKGGAVAEWRVETGPEGAALAAIGADGAPIGLYLQADRMADLGHARADLVAHAPGTWIAPADGREIGHGALMAKMAQRRVVLLGET
ncbi:MAG: ChuX/HutX family heme-like substrate-binding protein, partial [Alphaproteobacteria bacterium]